MYVSMSRLRVAASEARRARGRLPRPRALVDARTGFVDLQVWQSDRDPEEVLMV